ncbi:hypothetical protein BH24PSE2_BH24PSE2_07050 [soil metagenome]
MQDLDLALAIIGGLVLSAGIFSNVLKRSPLQEPMLGVAVAGLAMSLKTNIRDQHEEENIQQAVNKLFTLPVFVLFGAALPWAAWVSLGWPLAAFAASVLFLRRLPIVVLLRLPPAPGFDFTDRAYIGWFGPIGVVALYYAMLVVKETGEAGVWHVASAVIFTSILVHGATAAPFTRAYARARE